MTNAPLGPFSHGALILGLALCLLIVAKVAYSMFHRRDMALTLTVHDNHAGSIAFLGYTVSIGAIIASVAGGESRGFGTDVQVVLVYGGLGVALLLLADVLQERLFHRGLPGHAALHADRNIAAGIVKACALVGTGLVIAGSVQGEGGGPLSVIVFFALGQTVLSVVGFVFRRTAGFDVVREIGTGNAAAAISYGGTVLATGIVLFHASRGDFSNWRNDLTAYSAHAGLGLILIPALRVFFDKVWFPRCRMRDEIVRDRNWGIALLEFALLQVLAVLYVASFG